MVPIGAGSPIEAVAVGHEEGAVAAGLSTALGPVTIPTGTRPTQPQRPVWLRRQGISIIQDGGLPLSVSASFYASKETVKLLSFLPGRRWTNGLLLVVRMDRRLVHMEGMAGESRVRTLSNKMIRPIFCQAPPWAAAVSGGERTGARASTLLYLGVEAAIYRTSGVGNIYDKKTRRVSAWLSFRG